MGGSPNDGSLPVKSTLKRKKSLKKSSSAAENDEFLMKKVSFRTKDIGDLNLNFLNKEGKDLKEESESYSKNSKLGILESSDRIPSAPSDSIPVKRVSK